MSDTEKSGKSENVTVLTRSESRGNINYFGESLDPVPPRPLAEGQSPQPVVHQYGNPTPLGMLAYGTVFLCSSLLTLGAGGVTTPNLVLLFAMFYGGISQTLVGMWEFYLGHTFAATVFATYGGFNFSYGALYLPEIGIASAYSVGGVPTEEFTHAVGIYLAIWCLITGVFFIGALRTTAPIVWTLGMTVVSLACLSSNCFNPNPHTNIAGGAFGLAATAGAYYGALSQFYTRASTFEYIRLPPVVLAYSDPQSA
ncbi:GPR1/FUN34/yaaH family-domain-containing protein [Rhodofomes roseus]|uniref:GPR1/FUN34/yaaH family-domain-containing protein n=1 Tax=Rhodofomes roseus TaxID=34475 RepID=A0ABQ8K988_9APHY|nr:GPR1/FUN34/yaaH family-domain-containing protein [Rhodofomes roseus]KAH9833774.1 GPR1/FUN34/yaaH family-domain-containing protein [Rhodofomes roseus]